MLLKELSDFALNTNDFKSMFSHSLNQLKQMFRSVKESYEAKVQANLKLQVLFSQLGGLVDSDFGEVSAWVSRWVKKETGGQDVLLMLVGEGGAGYYWRDGLREILPAVKVETYRDSRGYTLQCNFESRSSIQRDKVLETELNISLRNMCVTKILDPENPSNIVALLYTMNKQRQKDMPSDESIYFSSDNMAFLTILSQALSRPLLHSLTLIKFEQANLTLTTVIHVVFILIQDLKWVDKLHKIE